MSKLSIPDAILIGSCIISVGVYLGFSQQPPATLTTQPSISQASPHPATPDQNQLTQLLSEQLMRAKPQLIKACPAQFGSATNRYSIDVTFNAEGQQIARGFSEVRSNPNPGLGGCLSSTLPIFAIPAPGVAIQLAAELTLP